jgi:hypothetical protein
MANESGITASTVPKMLYGKIGDARHPLSGLVAATLVTEPI